MTTDANIFLWIVGSVADSAAVSPNGIKTLLGNGLSTFPIKGNLVFSNGPKSLLNNPPDCTVLCNCVFDNFILAGEPLAKALRSFKTCLLVKTVDAENYFHHLDYKQHLIKILKLK